MASTKSTAQTYPGANAAAPSAPPYQQPLLDGQGQPSQPPVHVVDMNNNTQGAAAARARTRKQALGSAICMVLLALILLLTFLLPRGPTIELAGGDVGISGAPIYVNASFRFHNRNFYKTTFTNLQFGLYTLSDTGVGQIGTASYAGPIEVGPRGRKTIQVGIQTARGTGLNINKYCQSHPSILMFLANSSVEATSKYKDFGLVNVYSPYGALFMCPQPPQED